MKYYRDSSHPIWEYFGTITNTAFKGFIFTTSDDRFPKFKYVLNNPVNMGMTLNLTEVCFEELSTPTQRYIKSNQWILDLDETDWKPL